jgi:3-isopropylmalate dehydrogenase
MKHKVAVIEGDGVGAEVIREAVQAGRLIAQKCGLDIQYEHFPYGADHYLKTGETIPESVFQEWPKTYSALLLGALGDPRVPDGAHAEAILLGFRRKLDLYVNFRPVKLISKKYCPLKHVTNESDVDFVVFRENTEGMYAGIGGTLKGNTPDESATETCLYTYKGVARIIDAAFKYAEKYRLNDLLMGDKSNVMQYVGGLWQRLFKQTAKQFPGINTRHMYIDALCMQVIRNPAQFDVIVTSNMFGDILTDVSAQIQGGMGVAASANYNPEDTHFLGLFEPVHGSAPDIAGQGKANPIASVLSLHLMFQRMGYEEAAQMLHEAVVKTMNDEVVTPDLGGEYTTSQVGDRICKYIEEAN